MQTLAALAQSITPVQVIVAISAGIAWAFDRALKLHGVRMIVRQEIAPIKVKIDGQEDRLSRLEMVRAAVPIDSLARKG